MIQKIGTPKPSPSGIIPHFSSCVKTDGLVFVSGQLPFGEDGQITGQDITEQTHQCLRNSENILKQAGLSKKDIVKVTIWLTHADDFAGFNEAYKAFFDCTPPARTTVGSTLMVPGALVEIEVIAATQA